MSFLKRKTPEEKLFEAVQRGKDALVDTLTRPGNALSKPGDVHPSIQDKDGRTPLDVCVDILADEAVLGSKNHTLVLNHKKLDALLYVLDLNQVWNSLARNSGQLNEHKNEAYLRSGFEVNVDGLPIRFKPLKQPLAP